MATATDDRGARLRAERERLNVPRAKLAAKARCSLAQLGAIEAGAVPRKSAVLARAQDALRELAEAQNGNAPAGTEASQEVGGRDAGLAEV